MFSIIYLFFFPHFIKHEKVQSLESKFFFLDFYDIYKNAQY